MDARARIEQVVLGVGVDPEHCHVVEARPNKVEEMADVIKAELDHHGLSVVIAVRECIEAAKARQRAADRYR